MHDILALIRQTSGSKSELLQKFGFESRMTFGWGQTPWQRSVLSERSLDVVPTLHSHHACRTCVCQTIKDFSKGLWPLTDAYPKRWMAESAWLADLQQTVYPHKWSPVSWRSSAGQGKFAGQRPTFYHCATQPTTYVLLELCSSISGSNNSSKGNNKIRDCT